MPSPNDSVMMQEVAGDQKDHDSTDPSNEATGAIYRRANRSIGYQRRLQLQRFAEKIAAHVMEETKSYERCLLRRMVENLLPGEE